MKLNPSIDGRNFQTPPLKAFCASLAMMVPFAALAEPSATADTPETTPATEEEAGDNWIELAIGGANVNGNDAAFQRRHGSNGDFIGGIKSFRFEQLTDDGIFLLEGHAMFGLEDYEIEIRYDKDDIGFVRGGYREFRTWYDASGGYLPSSAPPENWIAPFGDEMSLDRGEVWFEAGLRMPDVPHITLGYTHSWRDGMKDSTTWGRSTRATIPSYWNIDEERDVLTLDFAHTLGNTDLGLGVRYETIRNDDNRYEVRGGGKDINHRDVYEADLFSAHITSVTRFGEKAMLTFGYSFTQMDTEVDGSSRIFDYTPPATPYKYDHGYMNMMGGSEVELHRANVNLWWNPIEDLVIIPSFRAGWEDISSRVYFTEIAGSSTHDGIASDSNALTNTTEQIEIRYSGVSDMLLYAKATWVQGDSDQYIWESIDGGVDSRWSDSKVDSAKYMLGATWYAARGLTFAAQVYNKKYDQDFDHIDGGIDPMMRNHSYETNDANLRVTWRALPCLTLVTRYDYQQTEYDNWANATGLVNVQSSEITRHIFSESITWNPTDKFYIQGGFHYVTAETDTGYDDFTGDGRVPDWDNDFWSATLSAGYAINKSTNLQATYYYYSADNYVNNEAVSTPYGSVAEEHAFTLTLNKRINENMAWNASYGYFKGEDDAAGGFNNYEAHVLSTGFRFSF